VLEVKQKQEHDFYIRVTGMKIKMSHSSSPRKLLRLLCCGVVLWRKQGEPDSIEEK
jgi:hypothetical protein